MFGKNDGISLSGINNGSAYGGYDWSRNFMGGSSAGSTNYFRPTSSMYDGLSFMGSASNHVSPLAIDLNGGGIETTHIYDDARVYFDIDNDGFAERVGWIKPTDGILALDRNGNGTIDNITELFGDYRMSAWSELALLDSNNDGKISAADAKFSSLLIWQDTNQNGISETGELKSLATYNITQLSLNFSAMDVYQKENYISGSSTVTYGNGSTKTMYDVHFMNDNVDTWFKGAQAEQFGNNFKVNPEALLMPLSRGYGSLPSLHIALTKNDTLMDLMRDLKNLQASDYNRIPYLVTQIMYEWAGVSNISQSTDKTAGGSNLDVRQLRFVEAFSGTTWEQLGYRDVLGEFAALDIHKGWGVIYNTIMDRLLVQSTFADLFPQATYDFATDKLSLNQSYNTILAAITAKGSADMNFIMSLAHILYLHRAELGVDLTRINTDLSAIARVASLGLSDAAIIIDMESPTYATDIEHGSILPSDANILKQVDTDVGHTMTGTGFNDYFFGNGGDDILNGNAGDDYLVGGTGNDTLQGGAGWDWLLGGDGADTLRGSDEHDYLGGGTGNDFLYGENGDDQMLGGAGADYLDGGAGVDTVGYMDSSAGVNVNIRTNTVSGGEAAGDTILNFENIHGSQYNDILIGNDSDNVLHGEAGNDRLYGGAGNDQLVTSFGASKLYGEDGNDSFTAVDGFDIFNGGAGNDIVDYSNGAVNSRIHVDLTEGWGQLVDAAYVTYYIIWPDVLRARYQRGEITFAESLLSFPAVEFFDMTADFRQTYGGNFYVYTTFQGLPEDAYISIENIIGSGFADYVRGDTNANSLYGRSGNDTLIGEGGNDLLYGEYGDDTLTGGSGTDTFIFNRDMGNDVVTDFTAGEILIFNEQYGSFNNVVQHATQVGSDTIIRFNNERSVTLTGFVKSNLAASQFQFKQITANDVTSTGTENHNYTISIQELLAQAGLGDKVALEDLTISSVQGAVNGTVSIANNVVTFVPNQNFSGQANFTFTISDGYTSLITKNVGLSVERINDDSSNSNVTGTDNNDELFGSVGSNLLNGGAGDDVLHYSGDSTWPGGFVARNVGSPDSIINGEMVVVNPRFRSFDGFHGGDGYDKLIMSDEGDGVFLDDAYSVNPFGQNTARLRSVEEIDAGGGNDIVDLTSMQFSYGDVKILGGAGNDVLWTSAGNDNIDGGTGNDNIDGGSGNDILKGGEGNDVILGRSGNDVITGGAGADTLTGGEGSDSFDYSFLSDSNSTAYDTITDFQQGTDKINLHDLALAGIISFDDLNITNDNVHNETIITANDNSATEHFELHLKGIIDLHQEDFVWG